MDDKLIGLRSISVGVVEGENALFFHLVLADGSAISWQMVEESAEKFHKAIGDRLSRLTTPRH